MLGVPGVFVGSREGKGGVELVGGDVQCEGYGGVCGADLGEGGLEAAFGDVGPKGGLELEWWFWWWKGEVWMGLYQGHIVSRVKLIWDS